MYAKFWALLCGLVKSQLFKEPSKSQTVPSFWSGSLVRDRISGVCSVAKGRGGGMGGGGREVQVSIQGEGAAIRCRPVPNENGKQACSQMT